MVKFGPSPVINALSTVVLVATMVLIFGGSSIFVKRSALSDQPSARN